MTVQELRDLAEDILAHRSREKDRALARAVLAAFEKDICYCNDGEHDYCLEARTEIMARAAGEDK